ncbi:hypothetical protein HanXRQr2_Chr01g0035121 [Helianthus annuus]|uniref:Uncharacterized protein n=1 Tax=Helianthus annuus TaxID=4232 RepID=A0A9K3JXV7_HELAN|nr:hypothetical protein HanXRQr2_Chr01g0035121 [Helianthus annuus]
MVAREKSGQLTSTRSPQRSKLVSFQASSHVTFSNILLLFFLYKYI